MTNQFEVVDNRYYRWYLGIVAMAKSRVLSGYVEEHHIVPRSLGGTDENSNIIKLTAREHFVCHRLLPKFLEGSSKTKMIWALWRMCNTDKVIVPARVYEAARCSFIETMVGNRYAARVMSEETKSRISNTMKSKFASMSQEERSKRILQSASSPESWTDARRNKIRQSKLGKAMSNTARVNMSNSKQELVSSLSDEERRKLFGSHNKRPWTEARRQAHVRRKNSDSQT